MRKAFVALFFVLMLAPAFAYDLNGTEGVNDWNGIGQTILRGSFGADPLFFAIIFIGLLAIMMWQANMPMGATLGIGLIILFALGASLGATYTILLNLTILAIGILVGLAILHFVRR
jgi:hypothetical protein